MRGVVFLVLNYLSSSFGQAPEARIVVTAQGPVRGYKDPTRNVFAFYGIPYATAPTGRDRYKAPLPPINWTDTFEAIDRKLVCPQGPISFIDLSDKIIQEDCLIVNIFVPNINETNLNVMVNFHGGGFRAGYGTQEPFITFADVKNTIVVNFNYRLGIHGFLCLGTEGVPGNAGLKDQLALLRWVNKNIEYFGGNPNDVTISGCSAGSGSVNLITLSKASEGLFTKVISDSGAHIGAFAVQMNPIENAKSYAKSTNFTNINDIDALEEYYRSAPTEFLMISQASLKNSATLFSPCVERDLGKERILEDAPITILNRGENKLYPMLYGFTDMEGMMRLSYLNNWIISMNQNFSEFLPGDLQFDSEEQRDKIAQRTKEFYFGDQPVSFDDVLYYVYYFTDTLFGYSMMKTAELNYAAGNSAVYLHFYSFYDENTSPLPGTDFRGANHCVQAQAVQDQDETSFTEEYRNMKVTMRNLWHNFITTGKPVPEGAALPSWPPVRANRTPYMSIGRTIELKEALLEDRFKFWDDIYRQHRRLPVSPNPNRGSIYTLNLISILLPFTIIIINAMYK